MGNNNQNKGLAIQSLMNNPQLQSTLSEGMMAPLGSSKRDKAKSILFNTGRASGVMPANYIDPLSAQMAGLTWDPNTEQMVPMAGQEKPKQQYLGPTGQPFTPDAGLTQGSAGLGVQGQPFQSVTPQQDLSKLTVEESQGPTSRILFIPEAPKQIQKAPIVDETFNKLFLTESINAPWMPAHYKAILDAYKGKEQDIPSFMVDDILKLQKNWETAKNLSNDKNFQDYWNSLPNTKDLTARDKQEFYIQYLEMGSPKASKISSTYPADFKYPTDFEEYWKNQGLAEKDKGLYYQQWQEMGPATVKKDGITPPPQPGEKPPEATSKEKEDFLETYEEDPATAYINMILGSASKTAFANQFAQDQQKLQDMNPGMSKETIDGLSGASVTGQVNGLGEVKADESKLDKQIDYLLDVGQQIALDTDKDGYVSSVSEANIKAGVQDTLDAYVRGKDEYLKKIDSMINDTEDQMLGMDMANPLTNKRMNSYLNYLTILKGRQNQRYIDYVDTAIRQHQNSINANISRYNILRQQYLEDKEMTQAQYDMNVKIGEEMWDAVKNAEKDGLDMSILQSKATKAAADSAMSVLELQDYGKKVEAYSADPIYYTKKLDLGLEKSTLGTKGIEMFNGNLNAILSEVKNEGKNPEGFLTALNKQIKDNAYTAIGDNDNKGLDIYFNNYKDVISEFYNTYKFAELGEDLTQEEKDEMMKSVDPIAQELKDTLFENIAHELDKYATTKGQYGSVPSFSTDVKAAIQGLVGGSGWIKKKSKSTADIKDETKTEEWRAQHETLPSAILDGIYDTVTVANIPENFVDPMEIFTKGYASLNDVPIQVLIDIIVNKGMDSTFNLSI